MSCTRSDAEMLSKDNPSTETMGSTTSSAYGGRSWWKRCRAQIQQLCPQAKKP